VEERESYHTLIQLRYKLLNATGLIAGTYHLTVTDNTVRRFKTVNITQPDDITITTDLGKDITCFNDANGEIKITITGGTQPQLYLDERWNSYATTEDISNLSPEYNVITVSDANNCGPKTAHLPTYRTTILAVSLVSQTNILCFEKLQEQ
jgi:hypothetical protein